MIPALCGWCVAALGLAFLAAGPAPAQAPARPVVWFAADDPIVREHKGRPPNDWLQLFSGDPAWARGIDVIDLSMQFVRRSTDQDLEAVLHFVATNHIQLSMDGLMLVSDGGCGRGVEGYGGPNGVEAAAQRVRQLGGTLSYLAMDEPMYYGSVYSGRSACSMPIAQVAEAVAVRVQHVLAIFPGIRIGDDEPIGSPEQLNWVGSLATWFDAYRAAAGRSLAFFHADINWRRANWPSDLAAATRLVRQDGIRLGIFYNGSPDEPDDDSWASDALQRSERIEHGMGIVPGDAIVASWNQFPDTMLPPTSPTSLTGIASRYIQAHR